MESIAQLLEEKMQIVNRLEKLIYGSIEIREIKDNKYVYVHYKEEGISRTKYAGEYSIELYNVILENNKLAKEYKKRLKGIKKLLNEFKYTENDLSPVVEVNIDLARKNLVDSIYKQSILEGVATTYSDTETIVNGGKVSNMTAEDVSKVVNLKHAWEFIMNKGVLSYQTNYSILCQINAVVEAGFMYTAGKIRSIPVKIGGSSYIPPIPFEDVVKEDINNILSMNTNDVDIAIELLIYVMKKQVFVDGNKRSAVIFANHYLISKGKGLIVIPTEHVEEYKKILINYYETEKKEEIIRFLKDYCYIDVK